MLPAIQKLSNDAEDGIEVEDLHFDVLTCLRLQLHIIAGVLAEEDDVTDLEELGWVRCVFADTTFAECDDSAFLRLLFACCFWDDDAGGGDLLLLHGLDDDAVSDGLDRDGKLVCVSVFGRHRE